MAGRIDDGQGVSGCFSIRKVETAGMRGPDFAGGRIEGDGFGVDESGGGWDLHNAADSSHERRAREKSVLRG